MASSAGHVITLWVAHNGRRLLEFKGHEDRYELESHEERGQIDVHEGLIIPRIKASMHTVIPAFKMRCDGPWW